MIQKLKNLKALVLDWAGTTIDHGSCAPTLVFQRVFGSRGVEISNAEAREPMGMAKREHIAAIAKMPRVAEQWQACFQRACSEADIDAMYADFLPLQKSILQEYSTVIPGVVEAVRTCRSMGLAIGSSTGYTHELMRIVGPAAEQQGYAPDFYLCAEDAPRGRPAPFLIFEAAKRLNVFPLWHLVKVDDTTVGIQAGRNAGCWTVGITRTGNLVGLSEAEYAQLNSDEKRERCLVAETKLRGAGAHYTLETLAELPALLPVIEQRISNGENAVVSE